MALKFKKYKYWLFNVYFFATAPLIQLISRRIIAEVSVGVTVLIRTLYAAVLFGTIMHIVYSTQCVYIYSMRAQYDSLIQHSSIATFPF